MTNVAYKYKPDLELMAKVKDLVSKFKKIGADTSTANKLAFAVVDETMGIYEAEIAAKPELDSAAGTIIARTEKTITWRRDKATLLNGYKSGAEDALVTYPGGFAGHTVGRGRYSYEPDPNGEVYKFSRRTLKTGTVIWKMVGSRTATSGSILGEGRYEHYDYNF